MSRITSLLFGSRLRVVATVVVGLAVAVGAALGTGVLGVPGVVAVENEFGPVTQENTTIETDLVVNNPNPIGVQLGGTTVNYTVYMNDVRMAGGQKEGLQVETGNSTLEFTTRMDNEQIPAWWHSHIDNGERTQVRIDARARSSLTADRTVRLDQDEEIRTDLIGQFNATEDRPVDANQPVPSDPVLWINETSASWDRGNLSAEETPMDMTFEVYNPKPYPYAVTELGYTIRMNGVTVGEGRTDDVATIAPRGRATIDARTVIDNERLDEWWVSHLQRNQVTDLEIQFYAVLDPDEGGGLVGEQLADVGEVRVPLTSYEQTVETDIFGTKPNGTASGDTGGADRRGGGERGTETPTSTPTPTATDDGGLIGTATTTDGDSTATGNETATTADGGLLG